MNHPSHFPDPEARPSLLRVATRLPLLAYRLIRWRALRGSWLGHHLWSDKSFDRRQPARGQAGRRHGPRDRPLTSRPAGTATRRPSSRSAPGVRITSGWPEGTPIPTAGRRSTPGSTATTTPTTAACANSAPRRSGASGRSNSTCTTATTRTTRSRAGWPRGASGSPATGRLRSAEVRPRSFFGYIAGNSALDNGAGDDSLSGCDTELTALREAGCYADFTFPSLGSPAQPSLTNRVYYATEDGAPRSHAAGTPLAVGGRPSGDLPIFLGPVGFNWGDGYSDDGAIENSSPGSPRRLGTWLRSHVHVPGRPEWVFIKLTTHAMQNRASFLGQTTDDMFAAMGVLVEAPALPAPLRHRAGGVQHRQGRRGGPLGQPRLLPRLPAAQAREPRDLLRPALEPAELFRAAVPFAAARGGGRPASSSPRGRSAPSRAGWPRSTSRSTGGCSSTAGSRARGRSALTGRDGATRNYRADERGGSPRLESGPLGRRPCSA